MRLYIGLLHYPVYNRNHEIITSAITNLDLHDMSRLGRTYGVKRFFVVTPLEDQREFAGRIIRHWIKGYGAVYNRDRKEAMELVKVVPSLEESERIIRENEGEEALLIATDASGQPEKTVNYSGAREFLKSGKVVFLLFGTAWGLHQEILEKADFILSPVKGNGDYNHLSVRTASGIILDRLVGKYS
ncbi:MAG: RNA methyltransferase [Deltaproteobacteria bacterium]|nr:RNA methyltransferase [Deltaproteobacteria bacterium]